MTEGNTEGQQTQEGQQSQQEPTSRRSQASEQGQEQEHRIPKSRFDQINKERKELADRLAQLEADKEREAEERARKQGEFESLAEKYKRQAEQEKQKRAEIENSWTRERRLNVWSRAASGIIKPEALSDAFSMLSEDEFGSIDETDDAGFKRLAESLAERKPYLADGPRGGGSGGSRAPVLGAPQSPNGQQRADGMQPILKRRKRPSWK